MKKGDIIIIMATLIISISSIPTISLFEAHADEQYAVIKVGTKEIKRLEFNNKTKGVYQFEMERGVGTVEIKDGRVRMLEMDKKICPNKICSITGWIDKDYKTIVCLPNKIAVSIENTEGNSGGIDGISF